MVCKRAKRSFRQTVLQRRSNVKKHSCCRSFNLQAFEDFLWVSVSSLVAPLVRQRSSHPTPLMNSPLSYVCCWKLEHVGLWNCWLSLSRLKSLLLSYNYNTDDSQLCIYLLHRSAICELAELEMKRIMVYSLRITKIIMKSWAVTKSP